MSDPQSINASYATRAASDVSWFVALAVAILLSAALVAQSALQRWPGGAAADALSRAIDERDLPALRRVLSTASAPDLEAIDLDGVTLLSRAVRRGSPEMRDMVEQLLASGVDVNRACGVGRRTPLIYAVCSDEAGDVAASLLAAGADPSAACGLGTTPLHWAAQNPNPRLLLMLLAAGADPAARDISGTTPLDWAKCAKNSVAIERLTRGPATVPAAPARLQRCGSSGG